MRAAPKPKKKKKDRRCNRHSACNSRSCSHLVYSVLCNRTQPGPAQPRRRAAQKSVRLGQFVCVCVAIRKPSADDDCAREQMLMMTANDADDGQESNATVQSFVVRDLGIKPTLPSQAADGDRDGATWYAAAASLVRWGRSCHRDERCVGCDAKRGVCDPRRRRLSDWVGCGRDGVLRGWEGFTSRSCRHRR
ncbi:hypothetical protein BKA81DRAFT_86993 [Phyllosticta paracitricarpa]